MNKGHFADKKLSHTSSDRLFLFSSECSSPDKLSEPRWLPTLHFKGRTNLLIGMTLARVSTAIS